MGEGGLRNWPDLTLWICYAEDELLAVQSQNGIKAPHLFYLFNLTPADKKDFDGIKRTSTTLSSHET